MNAQSKRTQGARRAREKPCGERERSRKRYQARAGHHAMQSPARQPRWATLFGATRVQVADTGLGRYKRHILEIFLWSLPSGQGKAPKERLAGGGSCGASALLATRVILEACTAVSNTNQSMSAQPGGGLGTATLLGSDSRAPSVQTYTRGPARRRCMGGGRETRGPLPHGSRMCMLHDWHAW